MRHFWTTCSVIAIVGLCTVVVPNYYSEFAMTIVDLAHAPAKARDGETY